MKEITADQSAYRQATLDAEANGIELLRDCDGGRTIVVLHGFNSVNRFYSWSYLHSFGEVYRLGLPGHGTGLLPRFDARTWTAGRLVDMAASIVERLGANREMTLVGHSAGAYVALGLAQRLERVKDLILVNPFLWSPMSPLRRRAVQTKGWTTWGQAAFARSQFRRRRSVTTYIDEILSLVADRKAFLDNPNTRVNIELGLPSFRRTSLRTVATLARVFALCDSRSQIEQAPPTMRTLIIHGAQDRVAPLSQAQWLTNLLPNATLETFEGVGHLAYAEREHEVGGLITSWLESRG